MIEYTTVRDERGIAGYMWRRKSGALCYQRAGEHKERTADPLESEEAVKQRILSAVARW